MIVSNIKIKRYTIVLICFLNCVVFSQNKKNGNVFKLVEGQVFGSVYPEPMPYVSIVIKSKPENKIITGGITNDDGQFTIENIPLGTHTVEVQFIGYKTVNKTITVSETDDSINLGRIVLEEDVLALEGVEITAERSTIEQKIDRKVISVGKDLTTAGISASDIIGNIPSVSINQDGEISLRGNENVRILVDGKPTNINATDVLQQIPSTAIKNIELITNPTAKYNPEGMSGIINIILKKNTNLGVNANVNTGVTFGETARYNNALGINYRAGKVNLYTNYGNRFGEQVTNGSVTRTDEKINQRTKNFNGNTSHLLKAGIDFYANDRNTLSFYTNQTRFNKPSDGLKSITFYNNETLNFTQKDDLNKDNITGTYNLDIKHDFKQSGHSLELEVDYNTFKNDNAYQYEFSGNSPFNNYSETIEDNRTNTTINLDYINPLTETAKLEIGLETRLRETNNSYSATRTDLRPSEFSYDRDIHSFYTTWTQNRTKWLYNLGVRLEDYNVNTTFNELGAPSDIFKIKLFNVFPSGFLKYNPDENQKNTYQLSFSRRIDRPSLNQINPIRAISTPQIVIVGNPRLNPQFTNSVELNYSRKLNKGNLSVGTFFRKIKDEINRTAYFDKENPTLLVLDYTNFESNNAYGFEFLASYKPTSWWNFNGSFDVYSRTQKGVIENKAVQVNNTLLNAKLNHTFKAFKNLSFQLFTVYTGPQKILQYERKDNMYANIGARYSFAKGKGTFSLNFNDVFKTQRFAFEAYRTIKQVGEFKRDTQTIYLGLSYAFGGGKNKALKRKKRDKNVKADRIL